MPSIIESYSYDIFISYRQKDNKYDGWVTEFVENLKKELEATFKEEVSVYFDSNPHDGLLETHDVDASLKDKLKCLVFIPVISRTYCDPKAFAWEYEFKKFIEQASQDQFGLKINLHSGNVTSRVLPVRIHELEENDIKLCESILGGFLRGVDFIYKSAGVNRPLRANEDYLQNNLNKICYRDQINKVANAVEGIIHSLRNSETGHEAVETRAGEIKLSEKTEDRITNSIFRFKNGQKTIRKLLLIFISISIFACIAFIFNLLNRSETRSTLAILPLRCQSNDSMLISKNDILTEIVMTKFHNVKSLTIRPRIATAQYRNSDKPLTTIREELDANYLVEGSIRREGEKISVWVVLNDAKNNKQLWSDEFIWDNDKISSIASEIVRKIAQSCNARFSPEEQKRIESDPTNNSTAYLNYISANVLSNNTWDIFSTENIITDRSGFRKAISAYDKAIEFDSVFAEAYARRAIAESWGYYTGQLDSTSFTRCRSDISRAVEIDKDLPDAQIAQGFYYLYCEVDYQKALVHFNRASVLDPDDYQPLFYMAMVYRRTGDWGKSQSFISKVIQQNPQVPLFLTNIGLSYAYLHKFDSALIYQQNAIDVLPAWSAPYENKIETILLKDGNISKARKVLEVASKKSGKRLSYLRIRLNIYDGKLKEALHEADQSPPGEFDSSSDKYFFYAEIYRLLENKKSAVIYFDSALVTLNAVKKYNLNTITHARLAIAYAGSGNKEKAIAESKLAVDLSIKDRMAESDMKLNQAKVFTMIGDYENAIINIEYLLENPSFFSTAILQMEPVWKPLLNLQEVKSLIEKYSE